MLRNKLNLRKLVAIAICLTSTALCITSCGGNTQHKDEWLEFATSVLKNGNAKNAKRMVSEVTISDIALSLTAWKCIALVNDAIFDPSSIPLGKDQLTAFYHEDAEIFIRSYEDLFDGEIVQIQGKKYQNITEVDVFDKVIIWVKKGGKTQGIVIDTVIKTPNGLRVLSWLSAVGSYSPGQLYRMRAILEDSECKYPNNIFFDTSFIEEFGRSR